MTSASPKVFISYSHDTVEHQERVLGLADRLRADGIDAEVDQYNAAPPEGWPLWCERQIAAANFVLMVCTETYHRRVSGDEERGKGLGVVWEARIIRQLLYDAGAVGDKFVPVLFSNASPEHIPTPIKGWTRYVIDKEDEYEELYRRLTKQPSLVRPALGAIRPLPARRRQWTEARSAAAPPALTLTIEVADEARTRWEITARRANGDAASRIETTPWQSDVAFAPAFETFWQLSRAAVEKAEDAGRLDAAAHRLGDALALALSADETTFLIEAARGDPPPPLLVIESNDDWLLALPWELIRLEGRFAVRDGRLDVARSVPAPAAPVLSPPTAPLSLLVNVSAPAGSGLDYERESYVIVRALHEDLGVVINEMGEVDDLIEGLRRDPPPIGVHFSGHGGPGKLVFEDEFGEGSEVKVDDLLTKIRQRTSNRLPRFFFLACCHGGDAPSLGEGGLAAVATALHRDGITQVVGYFGPVLDELSTLAERAFYAELAAGRRTRDAVRAARQEMSMAPTAAERAVLRDAGSQAPAGSLPYGWAQMVLYQRGADHPLGTRIAAGAGFAIETTERRTVAAYPGSRSHVLKAGFVGRRQEMHALRRDLRAKWHLHVVQGTGGLGKSAFCSEALKVYARLGWQPLALWCADVEGDAEPIAGLVRQVDAAGHQVAGEVWKDILAKVEHEAAHREDVRHPVAHLLLLLRSLLEALTPPLVVYLDNLETLLKGPATNDPDAFADWRDASCAALWRGLRELVSSHPGRLAVLASTRYPNRDFGAVVPFHRLPDDALWRMLAWFPSLRRLSEKVRAGLVARLAGHPRAVEFLDALIEDAIVSWEYNNNGRFEPGCLSAADEQARIVDTALPALDVKLSEDLLFDALWDRVLEAPARDLLVRTGVLRRPGDRALLTALSGGGGEAVIDKLRKTALLSEIRQPKEAGGWTLSYEVHPTIARLAERRSDRAEALRHEGHRHAGDHLEQLARTSSSWQDNIKAAYHLRQVGEADRAFDLLAPLVHWLLERGRVLDARVVLADLGDPASLHPARAAWISTFHGDAAVAYGDLSQALLAFGAALAIRERLAAADPANAGWQRDLSVSHNKIGDVLVAQGRLDDALASYRASLAIGERLAAADPANAGWQRDLSVSHSKIGDVLVAQGRLDDALASYRASLAIAERLAAADPANAGWQRDLSVSQGNVGDVLTAQGRLDDALPAYKASLAIAERLAAADPSNASWQRDLSVSHNTLGDVLQAQGRLDDALASYRASLAIRERLAVADPANAGWQRDLFVSYSKLGRIEEQRASPDTAACHYGKAEKIIRQLTQLDPTNARWQQDLAWVEARLATTSAPASSSTSS